MPQPGIIFSLQIFVLIAAICALVSWAMVRYSIQAIPNSRSAHSQPTPTAGGLALLLAMAAGVMMLNFSVGLNNSLFLSLFGPASMLAVLGLADDVRELDAKLKFGLIGLISVLMALLLGPVMVLPLDSMQMQLPWMIGMAGTSLWVFTMVNSVNFMDGADGVVPLSSLIAALGLAVLGALFGVWVVCWSSLLLVAALAGFLPFNMHKAKIFLGDTGSLFIGSWFAGSALLLIREGPESALWLMPLLFMPYLSDVLLTMAWRLRKRKNLLMAHNDHLYQLALKSGKSHANVALSLSLQIAITGSLAIFLHSSATSGFLGFVAMAVFSLLAHWHIRHNGKY